MEWGLSVNKWIDVKCSDVVWIDVIYVKWLCFEVKWSEVSYIEVLGDKSRMHIIVTLYWGYLIVLWLFYLVCILYCGCFNWFCNVWACVIVGFEMYGSFDNCVGVLATWVLVSTVVSYCFVYVYLFLFVTSVRTAATEWKLNCSK